ncbi:hypothetical protein Tco_0433990, partial [Tanacetum coccineum]
MAVRTQPTLSSGRQLLCPHLPSVRGIDPLTRHHHHHHLRPFPYRGGTGMKEGHGLEDNGPGLEEEEAAPEDQQQVVLVVDTTASEPLGLRYGALRLHELALGEG